MAIKKAFHARYQTSIDDEIMLSGPLFIGAYMRWGVGATRRVIRTDPAAALEKLAYSRTFYGGEWHCVIGSPRRHVLHPKSRATNAEILTPSHAAWQEFRERLQSHIVCPDFGEDISEIGKGFDFWPQYSAELIHELGYAVAESLFVMRCFGGVCDESIAYEVEDSWRRTGLQKNRPAFDATAQLA